VVRARFEVVRVVALVANGSNSFFCVCVSIRVGIGNFFEGLCWGNGSGIRIITTSTAVVVVVAAAAAAAAAALALLLVGSERRQHNSLFVVVVIVIAVVVAAVSPSHLSGSIVCG